MSKHIDAAVNSAEDDSRPSKTPRIRYYFCAAISEGELIHDRIQAETKEDCIAQFEDMHDVTPSSIKSGDKGRGYYEAKGTAMSPAQRVSITVTAEQLISTTGKTWSGQFEGWNVYASGLKSLNLIDREDKVVNSFSDDELVNLIFSSRVEEKSKVAKPKLKKNECVPLSKIENLQKR
jgi:hypothetical protein